MSKHKSIAAILFAIMMIFTMMSTMAFAASVKYWGYEFATVTDEDGCTFRTVRTFGSDGLIKAEATNETVTPVIGEPDHEVPTDETGEVAAKYFYQLDGASLVYGDESKTLDGSNWTQDAFRMLESQVGVKLVAPPYVKDYNAQNPAVAVLALDDFAGWTVKLEVSDYDDTQTSMDQRINVSIKCTPDAEINGSAAAPEIYGAVASAAITVKGEENDPTTAKVYLDAANEDDYATFSGGALTGLYDGETHTVVADTFPGYTTSYEVWNAATGRYEPVASIAITDVQKKAVFFRVVYTDNKTSAQIQTQGISLNLTPAKGAYVGFKLLNPEVGWMYSVEGSDYSIDDYISVEPMNSKPYSSDDALSEAAQIKDAACAKAVAKNEAEISNYFNELYDVVESVSENTPNLVDLAIVPKALTDNEQFVINMRYEALTRNIGQIVPGEGLAYSEVDDTARIILNGLKDHTLTHQEEVAATCTAEGNLEYWKCSVCGQYFKDAAATETYDENEWKVAKKAHDWDAAWTNNETKHWHKCKNCDEIKDEVVHSGGTATCKEKAKCEICEAVYGDFAAHDMTHHPKVDAGTTTSGNKEYWECSVCNKHFKDAAGTQEFADREWVIPATGGGDTPSDGGGTDSEDANVDAAQQVVDQISALKEPYDAAKVKAAREAYDKLTDEQKKDTKFTDEVMKKLGAAEAAVKTAKDHEAAGKVSDLIKAIPDDFKNATSDQVTGAVEAYNCLTPDQKKMIDASDLEKLQSAMNYPAKVQKAVIKSVALKKGKQVVVKWKKNSLANGYQIYLKTRGEKAKIISIKGQSKVQKTVKKLKAGKKYTIKIRTYVDVEKLGTEKAMKVYGRWSKVKKAKAKK